MDNGLTAKQWIAANGEALECELEGHRVLRRINEDAANFVYVMTKAIHEKEQTGLVVENAPALAAILNGRRPDS